MEGTSGGGGRQDRVQERCLGSCIQRHAQEMADGGEERSEKPVQEWRIKSEMLCALRDLL